MNNTFTMFTVVVGLHNTSTIICDVVSLTVVVYHYQTEILHGLNRHIIVTLFVCYSTMHMYVIYVYLLFTVRIVLFTVVFTFTLELDCWIFLCTHCKHALQCCQIGRKSANWATFGSRWLLLKFSFWRLAFWAIFGTMATTFGDLRRLSAGNNFSS